MIDLPLKYGCNPNQSHAKLTYDGPDQPLQLVNGAPSMINVLDALRSWQLVRDMKQATGKASATSFKHVSPAGAAVDSPLSDAFLAAQFLTCKSDDLSPAARAYALARASDRVASFGDFVAVSEPVDLSLATLLKTEVSDGIIAPAFDEDARQLLASKKGGKYVMLQIDPAHTPPATDIRREFGFNIEQSYNDLAINADMFDKRVTKRTDISDEVMQSLLVVTCAIKHTQSNSVGIGMDGQAIGIGAGQQSRILCTRLAASKTDRYLLQHHPSVLDIQFKDGVKRVDKFNAVDLFLRFDELSDRERQRLESVTTHLPDAISPQHQRAYLATFDHLVMSSDAFFPFRDNLDRAAASGVRYVAHAGGSVRDGDIIAAADELDMVLCATGVRLFLH